MILPISFVFSRLCRNVNNPIKNESLISSLLLLLYMTQFFSYYCPVLYVQLLCNVTVTRDVVQHQKN